MIVATELLAEGKTKKIFKADKLGDKVIIESKDDLTAGDGAKHDVITGKAELSNQTNANVFQLLKACGLPVAFIEELDQTRFLARQCEMIPYEVVVRREAHGSFLKRHPEIPKGHIFQKLLLEFFLKTSGKKWESIDIPKDDPLVRFLEKNHALLYLPDQPIHQQMPFLALDYFPLKNLPNTIDQIGNIAVKAFLVLEKAWQLAGRKLVDFKVEFGFDKSSTLQLADVIDNDSWRVIEDGQYIDKQLYRDGTDLNTVTAKYQLVAELTSNFNLPRQQIILWRASESDDITLFEKATDSYGKISGLTRKTVTRSLHKESIRAYEELGKLVQEIPDSVIIAYCGRSNGAGPILSAQCTVPVITVPATWREFPEDIWSSLRTPSNTPVATILDPKNAVLAALQILAMRNPLIYAELRLRQEARLLNILIL